MNTGRSLNLFELQCPCLHWYKREKAGVTAYDNTAMLPRLSLCQLFIDQLWSRFALVQMPCRLPREQSASQPSS